MMHSVIRLRLRPPGILRDEAVHQIEHHLSCYEGVGINFGETSRAEPRALRESAPVVDVRDGHVVNATRDAIRFTDTHHRNVDDFVYIAGDDPRKMTDVARSVGICE